MTPILSATLLRTQSDARLAALTREGEDRAFEAIVERYRRVLHRYLRRMLPESRTEDALQQTFIKAWSALGEGGSEVSDLKPWLYRIARNTALDALKKAGYDYEELQESLGSASGPDVDVERRTVMRETLAGVAGLPDRQREALLRVAVEGQSRARVAQDLGMSDGAVRQLLHRARMTLRAAATAITPLPVAAWAAGASEHNGPITQRVTELAAGGGAAGGAGLLLKGGAVITAAGALAVGPSALKPDDRRADSRPSAVGKVADAAAIIATPLRQPGMADLAAARGSASGRFGSASVGRGSASQPPVSAAGVDDHQGDRGPGDGGGGSNSGEGSVSSGPGSEGGERSSSGPGGGGEASSGSGSGSSGTGSNSGSSGSGSGALDSGSGSSGSGSSGSGSGASGDGSSGGPG